MAVWASVPPDLDYGEQMERVEPDQPQLRRSPGRFVVVAVGLAIVALGIAAGGIFRPIRTNVVDRSSAVSRALFGLLVGVLVAVAVMSVVRRLAWWKRINKPLVGSLAVLGIVAVRWLPCRRPPGIHPSPNRRRHARRPHPSARRSSRGRHLTTSNSSGRARGRNGSRASPSSS